MEHLKTKKITKILMGLLIKQDYEISLSLKNIKEQFVKFVNDNKYKIFIERH